MIHKTINDEDYPIGSKFLRAEHRHAIHTFYHFARAMDNIVDDPNLVELDKEARIQGYTNALMGSESDPDYKAGLEMYQMLKEKSLSMVHPRGLIRAFLMDIRKDRYSTWQEVIDYSLLSTAPVGRFYLDLFKESPLLWGLSDGVCVSIQVLNNLRDLAKDYKELNRVYLPGDWMAEATATDAMIGEKTLSPELRHVLNRVLDEVDRQLLTSEVLISEIQNNRLALEISILHSLIKSLSKKVRAGDVLVQEISLSKNDRIFGVIKGCWTFIKLRTF